MKNKNDEKIFKWCNDFLALAFLMGCSHENECTDKCSIRHSNDNYINSENI